MPYYVEIETETYGALTAQCGTKDVADRLSNVNTDVAGQDFAYVYAYDFDIEQPHNEHGAGTVSSAPALHSVTLTLPDYEPIIAGALNVLSGQDRIKSLTFNACAVEKGNNKLLFQYSMQDGMIVGYEHVIEDQRSTDAQRQRGHVEIILKFQQITVTNKVTNTQGALNTTHS